MTGDISDGDPLRPARGLVIGLLIGVACWLAIIVVSFLLFRR